ncbi:hypothetical protein ABEO98_22665 [Brevibacillus parabrevis]|uniref:hypothetical protein n=1 Tax=Brevibacillus parabrevis TaxID=54914 RepID=UPI003D1B5DCF
MEITKELRWSNGKTWGEIFCPMLGKSVMTYWKEGTPCYDTYTAPLVTEDNEIICFRYDHDAGGWHEDDTIYLGEYEVDETCRFA